MSDLKNKCKILFADDEEIALEIFKGLFSDDYDIKTVSSGEDALKLIPEFKPEIVVLDNIMLGIKGTDVCKKLKKNPKTKHIKVIIVSAKAIEPQDRKEGYINGADDYIIKPYISEDLYAKINIWERVVKSEKMFEKKIKELKDNKNK